MDVWMKVANTSWNDRETISSGYNEIQETKKLK